MKRWRDRFPGRTFARVGGVDLHYVREGKGPVVLFVHGLGDSHATWRDSVPLFAKNGFDAIALDLKGCGYSEKPERSDYSTSALVEEIGGFLDALKIRKAAIAGVSYGGYLSLRFATLHPERVSALVISNSFGYLEPMNTPIELELARMPVLKHIAHWFLTHRSLTETYRRWNFTGAFDGLVERVAEHWHFLSLPGGKRAYMAMVHGLDEALARRVEHEHARVTAPTLLVWGDADAWFPLAQAHRLQNAIRGAKLVTIKGGAHHMMEESPAAFAAKVAPFLARVLRGRRAGAKASRARKPGRTPRRRAA